MIQGIAPILFIPFDETGNIDAESLRNIVRFELDGGVHALGINGFASEAYKLTDDERHEAIKIVADEVSGQVPLIIGIASGSTEAAIHQAKAYEHYNPAALMTLPPATMDNGVQSFVDHYVDLGHATDIPIILQQSPHIPMYSHCELPVEALAEIADQAPNVKYFKIEGPGAPAKMQQLAPLLDDDRKMFGGGGGITVLTELKNGASGLIPGVGFNEVFLDAWDKWSSGDADGAESIIQGAQQLVKAVSGQGHEYSLHVRKHLMHRAGYINSVYVRKPTVTFHEYNMSAIFDIVDALDLRISQS